MTENKSSADLVSIGIPTFNRPENLFNILTCVTNQTYQNLEIIISDDASTDKRVREVITEFVSKDKRIRYYSQEKNIGILKNFHFVLEKSSGIYFTWISDDDWRSPEYIEELVFLLKINPDINWAFSDYHEVYEDGKYADGYPFSHLSIFKPFQSNSRFIRTLTHYFQAQIKGKCNLFYSLFKKEFIDSVDFKNLSIDYSYIGVDNQISFQLLQSGPIVISKKAMCSITCQNFKNYSNTLVKKNKTGKLYKLTLELKLFLYDLYVYLKNTNNLLEWCLILFLSPFKLLFETVGKMFNVSYKKSHDCLDRLLRKNNQTSEKTPLNIDIQKLKLPNVTLVSVDTREPEMALQALLFSAKEIEFGKIRLLSNYTPFCKNDKIQFTRIPEINGIDEWCYFIVYELHKYIDTEFILLIHADGFVVNPSEWRAEFLNYDYIGSPWPIPNDDYSYRDFNGNIIRVGNSVSIRSKRLLELPSQLNIPWVADHGFFNEDGFLCCANRHILEANGIKYAPLKVAKYFAHETMIPEIKNIKPFAFHKWMGSNAKYPRFHRKRLYDSN